MKKLRKLFLGATALAMAFSVSAMAACGNTPKVETPDSSFGQGEVGGNQNADLNSPSKKSGMVKAMEAAKKQSVASADLDVKLTLNDDYKYYEKDYEGKKIEGSDEASDISEEINIIFKGNFEDIDYDIMMTEVSDGGNMAMYDSADDNKLTTFYNAIFVRDGVVYDAHTKNEEITEKTPLEKIFSLKDIDGVGMNITSWLQPLVGKLDEVGAGEVSIPFNILLGLAEYYGGATYSNKVLTLDANKLAYNMYTDALAVIDSITDETTVGELLAAKPVKAVLQSVTYNFDVKEIYDEVLAEVKKIENEKVKAVVAEVEKLPAPTEKDTFYDYLVKLINEKKFTAFVISMAAPELSAGSMLAPIAEMTLGDIVSLAGSLGGRFAAEEQTADSAMSIEAVKALIKSTLEKYVVITESRIKINQSRSYSYSSYVGECVISGMTISFTLNDDFEVSKVEASATYESNGVSEYEMYDCVEVRESESTVTFTASVELSSEKTTLTDLSEYKCLDKVINGGTEEEPQIPDGVYYVEDYGEEGTVYYAVEVKDNAIAGVYKAEYFGAPKGEAVSYTSAEFRFYSENRVGVRVRNDDYSLYLSGSIYSPVAIS